MNYRTEYNFAYIPTSKYIANYQNQEKFIALCQNCYQYSNCWVCPPYNFNILEYINNYKNILLIGTKILPYEKLNNTEDNKLLVRKMLIDVRHNLDNNLLKLEKEYPDSKAFFAGSCVDCPNEKCTRPQDIACVQPDKTRFSLEAFGFDLEKTSLKLLHTKLLWGNDGEFPEYFTLISGFFTNHHIKKNHNKICLFFINDKY